MKEFIIKTTATMKECDCKKWYIDPAIIPEMHIQAENLTEALRKWRDAESYVFVSDSALRRKSPMYVDTASGTKQRGYVITGKCDFETDRYKTVEKYIDFWVSIWTVVETEF